MQETYESLNKDAKRYLLEELKKDFLKNNDSKEIIKRIEKEIEILYEKNLLFIVKYLYKFKKENKNVKYHFKGTINNLFVLYALKLSEINTIEYNLPYELFDDTTINVYLINEPDILLIWYLEKQITDIKIVSGFFVKEEIKEINDFLEHHYLLLPFEHLDKNMLLRFNDYSILETINDYRDYHDKYISIRIDYKDDIYTTKKVCIENVINSEFEKEISKVLKPQTINDYIKIKSIAHGTNVWNNNQDLLVKEKKIDINNLIATREDILEYLLNNSIERKKSLEIVDFIRKGYASKNKSKWKEYVDIMKKHNCKDIYIEIFSKILFIYGRGEAVSECLYALDKNNYV